MNIKLLAAALLVFCAAFGTLVYLFSARAEALPVLGEVPEFTLTNQSGEEISLSKLQGELWVADFFFTSCAGPCPRMTQQMAALSNAIPPGGIKFVSISVDPETDTPERLTEYGRKYEADFTRWHFLTGAQEQIQTLAVEGFKVGSVDDPAIHSTRFILVDRQGKIRGYFHGLEDDAIPLLQEAITKLLQETA